MADEMTDQVLGQHSSARSVLLSGLGFYKLSVRRRKQLTYVFLGSLAVHVIGLLAFGGWIVMRTKPEKVTIFETPPPNRVYEPRKLEHRVKLKKRQRSSSRPSVVPRLVAMKLTDLALPEIKVDPKLIHTTFQPKFKAVSGKGLGAGLGTGYGTDGFGDGWASVDFFGIQARGEKIAILVDVSVSMVEDERGGVQGYMRVKQRLNSVLDALRDTALFDLVVFADAARTMEEKLLIASDDNKTRAKLYLRPYNTEGNWGLTDGNVKPSQHGLKAYGGTTRLDLALTAAYEQGADTILIISDGVPRVKKAWGAEQMAAFQQEQAGWYQNNAGAVTAWDAAAGGGTSTRVWIPPSPARAPSTQKLKEGQPIDKGSPAQPGRWEVRHSGGHRGRRPAPPPMPDPGYWTLADFIEHLRLLYDHHYAEKGTRPPVIHCIGYMIDKDGHAFLQGLAKHFKGQYRRVAKLR